MPDGTPTAKPADSYAPAVFGPRAKADVWRLASPVTHITAESPPTFISQGLSDATVDYVQSVELANALRAKGVVHELLLLEGVGHMYHLDGGPRGTVPPTRGRRCWPFLRVILGPFVVRSLTPSHRF